jgi:bacterial leucyl aminopeptidase
MKHYVTIYLSLLLINCNVSKTFCQEKVINFPSTESTNEIISKLASDDYMGRKPGTEGFNKAAQYVENYLRGAGVKPFFGDSFRDSVTVRGKASYNVVGLIGEKNNGKEYIIIGAHLDHLGVMRNSQDSVYNGANDDASGVTAVMQIANAISNLNLKKNVIVALFTGEESGLIGSKHLAKKIKEQKIDLKYMVNFEMIGKTLSTGKGQVYLTGFEKSNMAKEMNRVIGSEFVVFLPEEVSYNLFMRSDNYAFFNEMEIPSQTLSSFDFKNYAYYHEAKDEVSELDIENMNLIIKKSTEVIVKLIESDVKIIMK